MLCDYNRRIFLEREKLFMVTASVIIPEYEKRNTVIQNLSVLTLEETISEDACHIIAAPNYILKIIEQLFQADIRQDNFFFYDAGIDIFLFIRIRK